MAEVILLQPKDINSLKQLTHYPDSYSLTEKSLIILFVVDNSKFRLTVKD